MRKFSCFLHWSLMRTLPLKLSSGESARKRMLVSASSGNDAEAG